LSKVKSFFKLLEHTKGFFFAIFRQKIFVELPSEALTYQAPADLTRKTLETNLPLNTMDIFSGCGGLSKGIFEINPLTFDVELIGVSFVI